MTEEPEQPSFSDDEVVGKKKKKKKLGTTRSIETLFRNMYRVHVEVSAMADNKANFLISVNSIILILAAAHGKEVVTDELLLLPAGIIITSCLGSMIFAVLVARPRLKLGPCAQKKPTDSPGLLFFASFTEYPKEDYVDELTGLVRDPERIYPEMSADIHDMGNVMKMKFQRLQIAYGFLLYGMPTGILLFLGIQTALHLLGAD